jgi:hypothetical protein
LLVAAGIVLFGDLGNPLRHDRKEQKVKNDDPYHKNGIHIVGHIKSPTKSKWYLALSQNGQRLKNITGNYLILFRCY